MTETQLESYLKIRPALRGLRRLVWDAIRENPTGLTCAEVEVLLGLRHQTASARIKELKDRDYIRVAGKDWNAETHRYVERYTEVKT